MQLIKNASWAGRTWAQLRKRRESDGKPGSVVRITDPRDRHSSRGTVSRTLKQPTRKTYGRASRLPYLVLLRTWYAERTPLLAPLVVSYTTVSPLPFSRRGRFAFCGAVRGSPLPGVTRRPALRSPDFPPRGTPRGGGLSGSRTLNRPCRRRRHRHQDRTDQLSQTCPPDRRHRPYGSCC